MAKIGTTGSWLRVAEQLAGRGWSRTRVDGRHDIGKPPRLAWRPIAPGSPTLQQGQGAHSALAAAPDAVRGFAAWLDGELVAAATGLGLEAPPAFNEVSWSRYPASRGRLAMHLDPADFVGVIAIVTLEGNARFEIESVVDGSFERWTTRPGDLVLLRGAGWPGESDGRPRHGAGPPVGGPRRIVNFRTNVNGAERGYRQF